MARLLKFFAKLYKSLHFFRFFTEKIKSEKSEMTKREIPMPQLPRVAINDEPKLSASLLGVEVNKKYLATKTSVTTGKSLFVIVQSPQSNIDDEFLIKLKSDLKTNLTEVKQISIKILNTDSLTITLKQIKTVNVDLCIQKLHELLLDKTTEIQMYNPDVIKNNVINSLKMGVCNYGFGADQMMVYQLAQSALMVSKSSEWLSYYCYSYNHTQTQLFALTPNDISDYIEKKRYILLFQPVFSLFNGDILQHEALLRVRHKTLGLLNAAQLLPAIKSEQQMLQLDQEIIEQVVKVIKTESSMHQISINIHQVNWLKRSFFNWLIELFEQTKMHKNIILEIAEADLLNIDNQLQQVLFLLKEYEVTLILDKVEGAIIDLGLEHDLFIKYNIKSLKLDYNLVHNINRNIEKQQKIKQITRFAKLYFLPVFAVGVEQKVELDMLKKLGVTGAQGHYFAEPLQELTAFSKV
ncbi:EAL domain, c-di-GMP-specific phosphodiesterase class I (or its enzymatically inactive variant) [Pseudoalteromonas denitrificans DSM 6059]|uniref:EAL domain, c-di-GMP-specific phosphodiesterase class I (Or its enzymatically inactive variant) n=2 Tax=Pseudoalteromonas TaxID=53246 RepID=A0A1I1UE09_9GAMM|nr:EAL domain, c-di-GMP-specific phosphodiesterase class I (or its enzymatically inactive variant) [Pseudoalteromonas denitrificans DSM 6059]